MVVNKCPYAGSCSTRSFWWPASPSGRGSSCRRAEAAAASLHVAVVPRSRVPTVAAALQFPCLPWCSATRGGFLWAALWLCHRQLVWAWGCGLGASSAAVLLGRCLECVCDDNTDEASCWQVAAGPVVALSSTFRPCACRLMA